MGNHEAPCIVCGENTMSAFNYDCEHRHSGIDISKAIVRLVRISHKDDGQPRDWVLRDIEKLNKLLYESRGR
jgi:hypothetical protein